jgi:hypothetical protein
MFPAVRWMLTEWGLLIEWGLLTEWGYLNRKNKKINRHKIKRTQCGRSTNISQHTPPPQSILMHLPHRDTNQTVEFVNIYEKPIQLLHFLFLQVILVGLPNSVPSWAAFRPVFEMVSLPVRSTSVGVLPTFIQIPSQIWHGATSLRH